MNSRMYITLLLHSTVIESGHLRPKMVSMCVSVSSRSTSWSSSCFLSARSSSRTRRVAWSLSRSHTASSAISSQGRMSPIFVSAHSFSSCLSLSPPMNSRSLVASPWVEIALHSSAALYNRHFEHAPLFLLGGRLSVLGPCFSPFCKVRTPDSHELQSCVATSHMEMNT